jgi:G3E family GTPase
MEVKFPYGSLRKPSIMRLLLVTGFLGSGKTTLVIKLAQAITGRGLQVAILVNEIGEIGIDDQLMRRLDLNVWELLNGCICCTLSADLVSTLHKLDAEYHPDLVIIEPSGAADPRSIMNAMPYYRGSPLDGLITITILDPLRHVVLMEVMTPLITSQIERADMILISKCDLAAQEEIEYACLAAQEINPDAKLFLSDGNTLPSEMIEALTP